MNMTVCKERLAYSKRAIRSLPACSTGADWIWLVISEVMSGAPKTWHSILTTQSYQTAMDFQSAICFHEKTLMELVVKRR
ncbi:hypothetical protein L218DRAFT_132394 [Marasmius fiardii PR-910]|nr:hypothetical protein L218DRAFT_132394 [Marasmius fiardii PR-910]